MFRFVDQIVESYEPKQKTVNEALVRLGVTSGADTSTDQYEDQQSLNSLYENIVWVYRCINFISSNLARVPWVFKKGDKDIIDTLEENVFDKPNGLQTKYDFLVESISRLEMQGEMFWELVRAPRLENKILKIYADWRSEEVDIKPAAKYEILQFERTVNGKRYIVKPENVFYVKYFNPKNPIRGISPLFPARHASATDLNSVFYNKQFFKQGARPSGVFKTDQKLTKIEAERLEEIIKRKYQSVEQMHEMLVLWGGLEYHPLNTMSMTDMQFEKLRQMNREEIIAAFGLSLEVLGVGQKTYQNVAFYRKLAWTEKLIPTNDKLLGLMNNGLVEQVYGMDGVVVEANYNDIDALKEERSKKVIDFEKGFRSGAITPNEFREHVFGFDPIDDPIMDETYINIRDTAVQQASGDDGIDPTEDPKFVRLHKKKEWSEEDRTKIWHWKIKQYENFEQTFKAFMDRIFDEIVDSVKSNIGMLFEKSVKGEGDAPSVPPSAVYRAKKFFDVSYWQKRLAEQSAPIILAGMQSAADSVLQSEGIPFDPVHPYVRQMLGQRVKLFSEFVSNTTNTEIKKLVEKALQQGMDLSIAEQTRLLQKIFDEYGVVSKAGRAAKIARTEAMYASNAGTQTALVQGGFLRKMWITSRDDRVRDAHLIDGQVVNVDQSFTLADGSGVSFPQAIGERCIIINTLQPITAG